VSAGRCYRRFKTRITSKQKGSYANCEAIARGSRGGSGEKGVATLEFTAWGDVRMELSPQRGQT